ncbi:hypothetical protein [Azospirillum brasilense]|uniref:Peptidase A1 domain-containing protein n=1 Tax=Azospirillum brasilense TaxID=192 RepID=A0A235H771_AZOBR|nr:hypothetical protein [Azospirillum brasilense]OYD81628.1 hypothetical protein CHT98_25185 [Azospirillum brasilense]
MSDTPITYAAPVDVPVVRQPFNLQGCSNSLNVTIGTPSGLLHEVQVDTGSTGVVIPATLLMVDGDTSKGLAAGVESLGPAQITYHPSGNTLAGCLYLVRSLALGASLDESKQVVSVCEAGPLVVFGAQYAGNTGTPGVQNPVDPGMGMMGVGFGRPALSYTAEAGQPDQVVYTLSNPFLSASAKGQPLYPSYLLSSAGSGPSGCIALGVTTAEFTADPFNGQTVALTSAKPPVTANVTNGCNCAPPTGTPWPAAPNQPYWLTGPATITISTINDALPLSATLLLDSGVIGAMMSVPQVKNWAANLGGAEITIAVPNGSSPDAEPVMSYSFSVSSAAPVKGIFAIDTALSTAAAPASLEPVLPDADIAFVNTGINLLLAYNYFFDAQLGRLGFATAAPVTLP